VIQSGDFLAAFPQDLAEMHVIIESTRIQPEAPARRLRR
jgi:hypothetical protein